MIGVIGVIGYGSLVNPAQQAGQNRHLQDIIPIRCGSYRRIFNQRPVWRESTATSSAVLNVHYSTADWLNAACYCYADFDFADLDYRERGYRRVALTTRGITCYEGKTLPSLRGLFIYLGKPENRDDRLLPHPDYLKICLDGARGWGEEFYRDFLNTTHLNQGMLLSEFISVRTSGN